jgi:hypothetical protein
MKHMDTDGDLPGFGLAKYDADQIANIIGFSHMADMHKITYDNSVEDAFNVHTENGIVKFRRDGRLYTYEPSDDFIKGIAEQKENENKDNGDNDDKGDHGFAGSQDNTDINSSDNNEDYLLDFVMTKTANRDGYTDRQYERAKRAWKLYINTGGGGFENFKHYL